jgi:hypothetical protein
MKTSSSLGVILALTFLLSMAGCSNRTDVNTELEQAVKAMESSEPAQAAAPPAPPPATPRSPVQPVQTAPRATPVQQVYQAVASYKAGKYTEAVTDLHSVLVQGSSGQTPMSPRQYMALQDAAGAVLQDLQVRAARGDAQAKQALEQYYRLKRAQ